MLWWRRRGLGRACSLEGDGMDEPTDPLARQLALSALTTEQFNLQTALGSRVLIRPRTRGSHGDDDLAAGVARFERPHGLGGLAQRVDPADERPELAGLDELPQDLQVLLALLGDQHPQPLTHEP